MYRLIYPLQYMFYVSNVITQKISENWLATKSRVIVCGWLTKYPWLVWEYTLITHTCIGLIIDMKICVCYVQIYSASENALSSQKWMKSNMSVWMLIRRVWSIEEHMWHICTEWLMRNVHDFLSFSRSCIMRLCQFIRRICLVSSNDVLLPLGNWSKIDRYKTQQYGTHHGPCA